MLTEQAEDGLKGAAAQSWKVRLELEHDNVRAALRRCLDAEEPEIRAPRRQKEGSMYEVEPCEAGCGGDVGRPYGVALQGEAPNHRELRRPKAEVVSVAEKARRQRVRCEPRRRT
jgi:hypothetical protein